MGGFGGRIHAGRTSKGLSLRPPAEITVELQILIAQQTIFFFFLSNSAFTLISEPLLFLVLIKKISAV